MATRNRAVRKTVKTHEGGKAKNINAVEQLKRTLYTAMLGENTFYENGTSIEQRLAEYVAPVRADLVEDMAVTARNRLNLRHAPLWVIAAMAMSDKHKPHVRRAIARVIKRADEPGELMAMWQDLAGEDSGFPNQLKKGIRDIMPSFDAYKLAKGDNKSARFRVRDVLRIVHPRPSNSEQSLIWKKAIAGTLKQHNTWEDKLSAGLSKKASFEGLMAENALGGLAFIRNLRLMTQSGVDERIISNYFKTPGIFKRVLPFRFLTAAEHAPQFEAELEDAMFRSIAESTNKLPGTTAILVDVSGSMCPGYGRAKFNCGLMKASTMAAIAKELCDKAYVYTFAYDSVVVPTSRRGFGLINYIFDNRGGGTNIGRSVATVQGDREYDRIIVITDEQSNTSVADPKYGQKAYMINVAPYSNGVGYHAWTHLDGFSEAVFDWMYALENDVLGERSR